MEAKIAALVILLAAPAAACGGDDGSGGGGDGDTDSPDAGPRPDGGGEGPLEPAAGDFLVAEALYPGNERAHGEIRGAIFDPPPQYHELAMEEGACQLWTFAGGGHCQGCAGFCDSEGQCREWQTSLSAGAVEITGTNEPISMQWADYGYLPNRVPQDLFEPGDTIELAAAGGVDVRAFTLSAAAGSPISIDLVQGGETEVEDTLVLEDGADLIIEWDDPEPGMRVRLELQTSNAGHGLPVDALIVCEADDTGSLAVPRALIEAFPPKPYQSFCVGVDCPPSSILRYGWARTAVGERVMELRVGSRSYFMIVHE